MTNKLIKRNCKFMCEFMNKPYCVLKHNRKIQKGTFIVMLADCKDCLHFRERDK